MKRAAVAAALHTETDFLQTQRNVLNNNANETLRINKKLITF